MPLELMPESGSMKAPVDPPVLPALPAPPLLLAFPPEDAPPLAFTPPEPCGKPLSFLTAVPHDAAATTIPDT
jgi:hypothetical protein